MAIGDVERLVEGLVGRGLGVSGLTQRAVGQAGIENLRSLAQATRTSEATRRTIERQQQAKFQRKLSKNRARAFALRSNIPKQQKEFAGRISVSPVEGLDPNRRRFKVFLPGRRPGAPSITKAFSTAQQLRDFIKKQKLGGRLGIETEDIFRTPGGLRELRGLLGMPVRELPTTQAQRLFQRRRPAGLFAGLRQLGVGARLGGDVDTPAEKEARRREQEGGARLFDLESRVNEIFNSTLNINPVTGNRQRSREEIRRRLRQKRGLE